MLQSKVVSNFTPATPEESSSNQSQKNPEKNSVEQIVSSLNLASSNFPINNGINKDTFRSELSTNQGNSTNRQKQEEGGASIGAGVEQNSRRKGFLGPIEYIDGAVVRRLAKDSPLRDAGICKGDVIVEVNNMDITNLQSLANALRKLTPGSTYQFEVLRDGRLERIDVKVGRERAYCGLTGTDQRSLMGLGSLQGVRVTKVEFDSPAYKAGVERGDIIEEVDGKICDADGLRDIILAKRKGDTICLKIKGGDTLSFELAGTLETYNIRNEAGVWIL